MKGKLFLGKVPYRPGGARVCPVYLTWELDAGRFSACGEIWNHMQTDVTRCGQCVDTVAAMFPHNKTAQAILRIWRRWHLNDMRAGCEHQRAAGWEDVRIPPSELPDSRANQDEGGILALWVYRHEHPKGLLCEPCPVCGYKYGTAWLLEEIPADVIAEIESWSPETAA